MPLHERFLPRKNPQSPGEKGTPFAMSNGLGRYFVVRQVMNEAGRTTTEYAHDERGRLVGAVTLAIRRHSWGADDDGQWYPVMFTVANLAFADTRGQYVRPQRERKSDRNP